MAKRRGAREKGCVPDVLITIKSYKRELVLLMRKETSPKSLS